MEMTKENGRWRINFFLTFRRFCALKLRIGGMERITAFEKSRGWAKNILKFVGIRGYVNSFNTVRSFDEKFLGIVES